jgi:hypothetical protein
MEITDQPIDDINREIPGILRAAAIGSAIGLVAVFVAIGGALYLSQHDVSLALGLGGMSAFWGGLGFGSMLGGTIHLVRHMEEPSGPTKAVPTEGAGRALEINGSSAEDQVRAAEPSTPDPRTARHSSQVA